MEFARVEMVGIGPDAAVFDIAQFYHIHERQNKFETLMGFHRFIRRLIRVEVYLFLVSELKNFGVECWKYQTLYLMKIANTEGTFHGDLFQT